jgi:hypothetical protein
VATVGLVESLAAVVLAVTGRSAPSPVTRVGLVVVLATAVPAASGVSEGPVATPVKVASSEARAATATVAWAGAAVMPESVVPADPEPLA